MIALTIHSALSPNDALAQQVPVSDPDIGVDYIAHPAPKGHEEVRGYLAPPSSASGKLLAVVVQGNRRPHPYIEDVAQRVETAGDIALAPDALTPVGGSAISCRRDL
jgi:carboxymethylenebutenolidase